ncbi:hypothetical protein ACFXPV_03125 [Streptomyces sp. NPDC059118]|uniref:hypothetical protein n=1 Tax=unclassified Streptomyces TaxID=2593676 RepID=UPI00367A509C
MAVPLLLFVALFVMQGCEGKSPELRSGEVVGVWKGSGGGRIEFRADGTFDVSGIPRSAVEPSFSKGGSFTGDTGFAVLRADRGGGEPEVYFEGDPDTDRGYRVRREVPDRSGPGEG